MKERPILFTAEMVRAILAGRKTQTRRIGKCQHPTATKLAAEYAMHATRGKILQACYDAFPGKGTARWALCECPYGIAGDQLWIRESFYQFGHWQEVEGVKTKTGKQKWKFIPGCRDLRYEQNPPAKYRKSRDQKNPYAARWHKRLARFMPRKASRLTLEIKTIRVERLCEITEMDALAEGILEFSKDGNVKKYWPCDPCNGELKCKWVDLPRSPIEAYYYLWQTINGPASHVNNPWVWVIEFKKLDSSAEHSPASNPRSTAPSARTSSKNSPA